MDDPHSFTRKVVAQLQTVPCDVAASELPAYSYHDAPCNGNGDGNRGDDNAATAASDAAVAQFATSSTPHTFRLGTGASQFVSALLPALLKAHHEILFVTCFWAQSKSLSDLSDALSRLATARSSSPQSIQPSLRIRICLSSRSLLQKLLHTSSRDGYVYPPSTWVSQLGLPSPDVLAAGGIDLSVKSLFFLPFSVMHPKYMVVDRKRAFLPSCNVSWEPWLEDCVEVTGEAVGPLVSFYARTWGDDLPGWEGEEPPEAAGCEDGEADGLPSVSSPFEIGPVDADGPGSILVRFPSSAAPLPTVILPSSHHRNPLFRPFPWQDYAPPPPTPLNLAMLQLFSSALRCVYIHSPNLTAEAVIVAVLAALGRGVDVDIVTGERMMVYEQILTAGTTTARCVRNLIKRYNTLLERRRQQQQQQQQQQPEQNGIGRLTIMFYQPLRHPNKGPDEEQAILPNPPQQAQPPSSPPSKKNTCGFAVDTEQPVHSHIKLTIVDGEHTVLGSGNMDRASFFTSQELGILFHSTTFAHAVQSAVDRVLDGRLRQVYPPPFSE
ncbi:hypothetical protein SCUCBS95973_005732 [Sporothrix curviconia]|uniref:PLD phosphodiesterase domain-containing protein n=1 Tax=Sporothrix curviconia TaxID=1260050 RepID=A0ABP0C174_9PEZI